MKQLLMGLFIIATLTGCSTMTVQPQQTAKRVNPPTFEETYAFFFWGLVGEERVDVKAVCGDKKPVQMQTQATFTDGLFSAVTLGIYSPHTAKVWCE